MSFASRSRGYFSSAAAAARTSFENARSSFESATGTARSSVSSGVSTTPASPPGDEEDDPRIAYAAVSRNETMLAEVVDPFIPEEERDFAIALGRKLIRRKAPPGWEELSSGRHHAVQLPIHDLEGCTSYVICFSRGFPADHAQAFLQKLSLLLDPLIEKCANMPTSREAMESKTLVILPVLERELQRGNQKEHQIGNSAQAVKEIILQNIEVMLDRDEKLSEENKESAALFLRKKTRALKRYHYTNQVKWSTTVGNLRTTATPSVEAAADTPDTKDSLPAKETLWICEACDEPNRPERNCCNNCGKPLQEARAEDAAPRSETTNQASSGPRASAPEPRQQTPKAQASPPKSAAPAPKASVPASKAPSPSPKAPAPTPKAAAATSKGTTSAPKRAPVPEKPAEKPETPRTRARNLVGTRLSAEQASRAAELILKLEPYVDGRRSASLDDIWNFFDVQKPSAGSFRESDPVAKSLKGKLNRLRLLLHPDKNRHPKAEATFKFLEQCNDRLIKCCLRRDAGQSETAAERTRREEQELKEEQARRERQQREREEFEERRRREEEAEEERLRKEEERRRRVEEETLRQGEAERKRLEWMLRSKQAKALEVEQQILEGASGARMPSSISNGEPFSSSNTLDSEIGTPLPSAPLAARPSFTETYATQAAQPLGTAAAQPPAQTDQSALKQPAETVHDNPASSAVGPSVPPTPSGCSGADLNGPPIGKLKLTIICARGVPSAGFWTQSNAYAFACVGFTKFRTPSLSGCNPAWGSTFEFEVHVEDQGLIVTVWREGWGYSLLGDDFMGRVEIPFLDLEDWSGCVIGRVLEAADPEAVECLEVDLKASIEWY